MLIMHGILDHFYLVSLQSLVRSIEQAASEYNIKTAVSAVHALSQDSNEFSRLIAQVRRQGIWKGNHDDEHYYYYFFERD